MRVVQIGSLIDVLCHSWINEVATSIQRGSLGVGLDLQLVQGSCFRRALSLSTVRKSQSLAATPSSVS